MSDIQFLNDEILINGVSSKNVAKTLKDAGLKDASIVEIVGGWFTGVTGGVRPAGFQFATDVETVDPNCEVTYTRGFSHNDWIDGESRVQAGMTPEELGFNARFHSIENEFDAIAAQLAKVGNCNKELRADLIGVVHELEAKITALQNSIYDAKPDDQWPDLIGPIKVGPNTGLLTKFGDNFEFMKYETTVIPDLTGPRGPVGPIGPLDQGKVFVPKSVKPDDMLDIAKNLGLTFERDDMKTMFKGNQGVTVGDLRAKAPDATLPSGHALGSVIATLPAETKFNDANDAVAKITEHVLSQMPKTQTDKVKTGLVTTDAQDRTGTALVNSGIIVIGGVEEDVSEALHTAGLGTIGKLSNASTRDIATALAGAGLDVGIAGDLAAKANLLKALRNF